MDERKYRSYAKEFKLEALELLKRGDKSASEIERELGITTGMLLKWKQRYQVIEQGEHAEKQLGPSDLEGAKAEIRRLQRELAAVEEEREILKKALNIFSRKNG
jgi:transposase